MLMFQQSAKPDQLIKDYSDFLDSEEIASESIQYGEEWIDPILFEEILKLEFTGGICDLGCGLGTRLLSLCKARRTTGLGMEIDPQVLQQAKKGITTTDQITLLQQEISHLSGTCQGIELVMQSFLFHDFDEDTEILNILNSLDSHFPDLKYFTYVDIVGMDPNETTIFPGFDFVHGLMKKTPYLPRNNFVVRTI